MVQQVMGKKVTFSQIIKRNGSNKPSNYMQNSKEVIHFKKLQLNPSTYYICTFGPNNQLHLNTNC